MNATIIALGVDYTAKLTAIVQGYLKQLSEDNCKYYGLESEEVRKWVETGRPLNE